MPGPSVGEGVEDLTPSTDPPNWPPNESQGFRCLWLSAEAVNGWVGRLQALDK